MKKFRVRIKNFQEPTIPIKPNEIGDIFKMSEFAEMVRHGCITDYDGWGYYCNEDYKTDEVVLLSPIILRLTGYSHVLWYNK